MVIVGTLQTFRISRIKRIAEVDKQQNMHYAKNTMHALYLLIQKLLSRFILCCDVYYPISIENFVSNY